jgi:GNAT superfamily N-acetyltransferase
MNAQPQLALEFDREFVTDVMHEIKPLLEQHFSEIAHYPDIPLNVNHEAYLRMESTGSLRIYTIRMACTLVGYAIFTVSHSLHYSGSLQAKQDVLYLDPSYRKGRTGWRFIEWCDAQLKAEGVQVVYQHVKAAHNFGPMLERIGYELVDCLYGRRLDGC